MSDANDVRKQYRRSASELLRALGSVFHASELGVVHGMPATVRKVYLHRWKEAGLIEPLGGRSQTFINRVAVGTQVDAARVDALRRQALKAAIPAAVEIGANPLRRAGWTTQISHINDIAVPARGLNYELEAPFRAHKRSHAWYRAMHPFLVRDPADPVEWLTPAAALADALFAHRTNAGWLWAPDPDDLYLDLMDEEGAAVPFLDAVHALQRLHRLRDLDLPGLLVHGETMEAIYDPLLTQITGIAAWQSGHGIAACRPN